MARVAFARVFGHYILTSPEGFVGEGTNGWNGMTRWRKSKRGQEKERKNRRKRGETVEGKSLGPERIFRSAAT